MRSFNPDLIIEVTSACNRSCSGCYAPNVVSNKSSKELMLNQPGLFLETRALENLIMFWEQQIPEVVSIRGGEPSLHPELPGIFKALKFFSMRVVLETHGRWLLEDQRTEYAELISSVRENSIEIKISFDSMHRLQPNQLKEITSFLESRGIKYLVAITETTMEDYFITKSLAAWVDDSMFIFQKKAESVESLIKPWLGVIGTDGTLKGALNSKFSAEFDLKAVVG